MSWDRAELGRAERWIRGLGLAIWAFVGLSRLVPAIDDGAPRWLAAWLAYGTGYGITSAHRRIPRTVSIAALVVQTGAVVVMPHVGFTGFDGLLMSIIAVQVHLTRCCQ